MIEEIIQSIRKVVGDAPKFSVTASEKPEFGHYATNVGFMVEKNPQQLADEILRAVQSDKTPLFEKIDAKGKFINFWMRKEFLAKKLTEIVAIKKLKPEKRLKINLEFVSANPTGPLTMANGRGGFLGDALANVLAFVGHKVTREYYINDAGNQVRVLGESVLAARGKAETQEHHYQGEYIKALAEKMGGMLKEDVHADEVGRRAAELLLEDIEKSLAAAGIEFDEWYSERKNLRGKALEKVLALLEKKGVVRERENAKWLTIGDSERVLIKSDGEPTYLLVDIAYHYNKLEKRGFDAAIDIWGADHHGNVEPLKKGIGMAGVDPRKLHIIVTQLVRLVEGGKEVRMSKRKGEFVTMDELLAEVGRDAARFFFLMNTSESHMDFDLALAKERSLKNPVYYAQYAHVRCHSILEKAGSKGQVVSSKLKELKTESELALLRELVQFLDVVRQTAEDYQVNRLTRYVTDVARALHYFYEQERVLDSEGEEREARLALVAATQAVLQKVFGLMGIAASEEM